MGALDNYPETPYNYGHCLPFRDSSSKAYGGNNISIAEFDQGVTINYT